MPVADISGFFDAVGKFFQSVADIKWIPLLIGVTFTVFGCLKLYGLSRGIVGGGRATFKDRLCGT